jgi:hypothetical protein
VPDLLALEGPVFVALKVWPAIGHRRTMPPSTGDTPALQGRASPRLVGWGLAVDTGGWRVSTNGIRNSVQGQAGRKLTVRLGEGNIEADIAILRWVRHTSGQARRGQPRRLGWAGEADEDRLGPTAAIGSMGRAAVEPIFLVRR